VILKTGNTPGASADASREELEQRRNILQNMKDFDFQIKKNQEEITNIYEKVESLSKDLDDLVSLYEIVSEQMNPFVGLSKVTKKRLDALENIIKEVDGVKTRIGDLESTLQKNGVTIKAETMAKKTNQPPQTNATPETAGRTPKGSLDVPSARLTGLPPINLDKLNERDLDDLINRSFESLLMEQNIDTLMNEFFINLK
jgi:archaellum component FlaC